ncbi:MAG: hypothetical protein IPL83_03925 [Bdellovibrionales bacterium]|nr:hypothetical protein [Bdellovibrionales bacterium]
MTLSLDGVLTIESYFFPDDYEEKTTHSSDASAITVRFRGKGIFDSNNVKLLDEVYQIGEILDTNYCRITARN